MKFFELGFTTGLIGALSIIDKFINNPLQIDPVAILTLVGMVVAIVVSIIGMIVTFRRGKHQDAQDDSVSAKASQETADIATSARLRLELRVEEQNKQIAALVQQLVEKGPMYSVSFMLDTGGQSPTLDKINIQKLAERGIIVDDGTVTSKGNI